MDERRLSQVLLDIYRRLLQHYGPQHWWPAHDSFEVIVGAILTQSTSWKNVEKAIVRLREKGALSAAALRQLSLGGLAELIRPCGYYNVKAARLKSFVQWLGDVYKDDLGKLFQGEIDLLRRQLLEIRGIGEETADAIILYAANRPVFVIDAYTRRIVRRLGLAPASDRYQAYQELFMKNLPADVPLFNEYHALLVRLGKDTCRKVPVCRSCCLNPAETGTTDAGNAFPCTIPA